LLSLPQGAGLETLYAALLISTIEKQFSSINALPKGVSNSRWIMHLQLERA